MVPEGQSSWPVWRGAWQQTDRHGVGEVAETLLHTHRHEAERKLTGMTWTSQISKPASSDTPPSPHFPIRHKVSLTGGQDYKHMSLWRPFSFKPPHLECTSPWVLFSALQVEERGPWRKIWKAVSYWAKFGDTDWVYYLQYESVTESHGCDFPKVTQLAKSEEPRLDSGKEVTLGITSFCVSKK